MITKLLTILLFAASVFATDSVTATTLQDASEDGTVGVVQFHRDGTNGSYPVYFSLTGTAIPTTNFQTTASATSGAGSSVPVVFRLGLVSDPWGLGNWGGSITFPDQVQDVLLTISPAATTDGLPGGKTIALGLIAQLPVYNADLQNETDVIIADIDAKGTLSSTISTAYPTPPINNNTKPIPVQGAAEWHASVQPFAPRVSVLLGGDPSIGPEATLGTDYWLVYNSISLSSVFSGANYQFVHQPTTITTGGVDTSPTAADPGIGSTVIPMAGLNLVGGGGFGVGDVVCFEAPTDVTNGLYIITAVTPLSQVIVPGTAGPPPTPTVVTTTWPTIVVSPAIRNIQTTSGVTRVRRIGRQISFPAGLATRRSDLYGAISDVYYWAFPFHTGTTRGRSSVNLTLVQTADFQTQTPSSSSATIADDTVIAGVARTSNGGQPGTPGLATVSLNGAFPVAIDMPFLVTPGTMTYGTDFTISGVNPTSLIGSVHIPAGSTTGQIIIQPKGTANGGTITIRLLGSPDYLLAPGGTSSQDPTTTVAIAPPVLTHNGQPLIMSVAKFGTDGFEGTSAAPARNLTFRISLSDSSGNILAGDYVGQDIGLTYTLSGTAQSGINYQAVSGSAVLTAGQNHVDVTLLVKNDGVVGSDATAIFSLVAGTTYQVASNYGQATGLIVDSSPSLSVAVTQSPVVGGASGLFTITNANPSNSSLTIQLTAGGTGVAGTDYTAMPSSILLGAGQSSAQVAVAGAVNGGVTVSLTVAPDAATPATYKVGSPSISTMTIASSGSGNNGGSSVPPPAGAGGSGGCGAGAVALLAMAGIAALAGLRRRRES